MTNPHESAARQRKALALVNAIWRYFPTEARLCFADSLPAQPEGWWADLAKHAGVNPPSPETIELVCKAFEMREQMTEIASLRNQRWELAKELDEEDAKRARRRHARRSW